MNPIKVKPRGIRYRGRHCDVLFFGESPGREEAQQGIAFVGPSGQHIERVIEAEIPDRSVVLDNVCPEWLDGAKPLKKELDRYAEYRTKSIERFRPKVIVVLGAVAIKGWGLKASPTKDCGRIMEGPNGIPVVISIHPAFILRDPTQVGLWRRVFAAVQTCLTGRKTLIRGIRPISDPSVLAGWLHERRESLCGFDIETSSLDPKTGNVLCAAISDRKESVWVPLFHQENPDLKAATMMWSSICEWWSWGPRIVHNLKFELAWMRHRQAIDPPVIHDTMLQAWLLNENEPKGLDHLVTTVLKKPPYWTRISGDFGEIPLNDLGLYNALDARYSYDLHVRQVRQLGPVRVSLLDRVVSPLAQLLVRMEERGIHADRTKLERLRRKMQSLETRRLNQFRKAFPEINHRSPDQIRRLVFRQLGLISEKTTTKGRKSVDREVLNKLAKQDARLAPLAEARQISSLLRRVLLPWAIAAEDGFIHTNFSIGQVVTGRLASSNPNMQNIDRPSKTLTWKGCQRIVLTSRFRGGSIIQFDQKQGELRVQAAVAGDEAFLQAFREGEDPHQITADALGCDRAKAKNVNFSIIYLISPFGLEQRYGIPRSEGAKLIERWYDLHPRIRSYQEECFRSIREQGFVESIFGWRRHLTDMTDDHERSQAVNFGIQNACVVITYLGMLALDQHLRMEGYRSVIVHQVHDSIVVDTPYRETKRIMREGKAILEGLDLKPYVGQRLQSSIPLGIDVKAGGHF